MLIAIFVIIAVLIIKDLLMKKLGILTLLISLPLHAGTMGEPTSPSYPWFASIGTGYSWTLKPGIKNPDPTFWDFSVQGYDSSLGDRGFYTFALGKQVHEYLDLSLSYLAHEEFNYQKYQTGVSSTPNFSGSVRNRYFKLNNRALLINGFLHPASSWYQVASIELTPFIGAGLGYARNKVNDFHTVATVNVNNTFIGSTTTIGNEGNRNSFAWQGTIGLNLRPQQSHFSVDFGYRYFDGGKFEGPRATYGNQEGWLSAKPWSGRLKANQAFVEFKYSV